MARRAARPARQKETRPGFYSRALSEAEQLELAEAADVDGLDNEIAILRVKLRHLLEDQPDRIDLHMRAANTVARLIRTRYNISQEEKHTLKEAISTVLKEVAIPLGLKFIP